MTGKQYLAYVFRTSKTDEQRAQVFNKHSSYLEPIKKDVAAWVDENWDIWMLERPEWLTPKLISRIPKEMIPANAQGDAKVSHRR